MERMTRMMQSAVLLAAVLAATVTLTFAQGRDFAGSWTLDADKSGTKEGPPLVVITLTPKEFTARFGGDGAQAMPFNLDGTERVVEGRGTDGKITTKAMWKGDKLVASVKMPPPEAGHEGDRGPDSVTFSRDGAWLVLEATTPDHGPMKLYFKKTK